MTYEVLRIKYMNEMQSPTVESFTDLRAWQEGHKLVLMIYSTTQKFPMEERYGLTDQLRRAAVSVTSNIAEGFSQKTAKAKQQFFWISLASLTGIQNQLLIARDVHYLSKEIFQDIAKQSVIVHKMINGLMKSAKTYVIRNT